MKQKINNITSRLASSPLAHQAGLFLVYAGALLLIIAYVIGKTGSNLFLLLCLFLIAIGIVMHVMIQKHTSRY